MNRFKEFKETVAETVRKGKEIAVEKYNEQKLAKTRSTEVLKETTSIFGKSLKIAYEKTSNKPNQIFVPAIVFRCINYIEKFGLSEVGIYRLSGSLSKINETRLRFNDYSDCDLEFDDDESFLDVHIVTGVLKAYLRELPENILTKSLSPKFQSIIRNYTPEEPSSPSKSSPTSTAVIIESNQIAAFESTAVINEIRDLCQNLPPENYYLLRLFFKHLFEIQKNELKNKMTISNLQVIFSPTLGIGAHLLHVLILQWEVCFPLPFEKDENEIKIHSHDEENDEIQPPKKPARSHQNHRVNNIQSTGDLISWEKF